MVITLLVFCVLMGFLLGDLIACGRRIWWALDGRDWQSLPEPMNVYLATGLWTLAGLIWLVGLHQSAG